jgi:hypothetical protein
MALIVKDRIKETSTSTGTGNMTLAGAVTGFKTFASVMANNDTCYYVIEMGSEWEVGYGTFVSATPALARTTLIASSTGSAVNFSAGTKNVFIANLADRLKVPELSANPETPASGAVLFSRNIGGRHVPRWIGPSGLDTAIQPGMWGNSITLWLPGTGTTAAINFGVNWSTAATQAHPAITTTNFMTQLRRATYTTTTTANNASGVRSGAPLCWRGNAAGQGGWFFSARFGILTYTSTMRMMVGLSESTAALSGDPSAVNNTVAMSKDTGETTWQVFTRDASAASKTSTGRTTAAAANAEIFEFVCFCKPNDSKITVRVVDITSGTVLVDNVEKTSNLPSATALLTAHAQCNNQAGGAGSGVAMFLSKIYVETDN